MKVIEKQKLCHKVEYPKIFETGIPENYSDELLIADGLCAWGNCYAGHKPPENFGNIMSEICFKLGTAQPDKLMELADKYLKKKKGKQ